MVPPKKDDASVVTTNPDPTAAVKEAVTLAIKNLEEKIEGRFVGNDEAVKLARDELRAQLIKLESAINEKFVANEKLVDQLGKANSTALTAALATQEKSYAEMKLTIGDSLKQMKISTDEAFKATNEKIDRLTPRFDFGEGRSAGVDINRRDNRQDSADSSRLVVAVIGVAVAIAALVAGYALGNK